jgi:hypothetical protein
MSVALSIAFTGLCALIADGDGAPGQVLLPDARGLGVVGGVTLPDHTPTLVISLRDLANPASSRPTRVIVGAPSRTGHLDQLGVWDLTGSQVRIRAQGEEGSGLQLFRPKKESTSWPEAPRNVHDAASWRDVRFIADMKALVADGRIDPALSDVDPGSGTLPASLAARIHLDAGLLEAGIPSQEAYRDDVFEFTSLGSDRVVRQALTDTIQWTLKTQATAVVIEIVPVAGGAAKRLLLAPSETPHRVFISNLPAENASHDDALHAMSDDEMGALHFGAYYKLLKHQPVSMPLPRLSADVHPRKGAGMMRTQFCPPARFSRQ